MINIDRVKKILLSPTEEWAAVAAEPATIGGIIRGYLGWLALIPAIAGFIGMSIIGMGMFGVTVRVGVMTGIAQAIVGVVMTVVMAWVVSLIVNWFAPKFGGTQDPLAAFKLVAYASTAALVAGVAQIVPMLAFIGLLGGLYSIYLFYIGLPVLMKSPASKSLAYTAVIVVCAIVVGMVVGAISSLVTPWRHPMMGSDGSVSITTPSGEKTVPGSKIEEMSRRFEEMGKRIEEAKQSGDPNAVAKATREGLASIAGSSGGRAPMAPAELKALLPDTAAGLARKSFEAQQQQVMGMSISKAQARYVDGERSVKLEITDPGSAAGLVAFVASWASVLVDRETESKIEKTFKNGERVISETVQKNGSAAGYKVMLANGIVVDVGGRRVGLDQLKTIAASIDLNQLEARK